MKTKEVISYKRNYLPKVASLVIIIWGLYQAQSVIALLLVAIFLAVIGSQPLLWLEKKGLPSTLSALVVILTMFLIILLFGVLVGTSIANFASNLSVYQSQINEKLSIVKSFLVQAGVVSENVDMVKYIDPSAVIGTTTNLLSGLTSTLSNIFLVFLIVMFILLEVTQLTMKIGRLLKAPNKSLLSLRDFIRSLNEYMYVKTIICIVTGILSWLLLLVLGLDFPILWGFFAFLLNYVPSIGVIIAVIPPLILAFVQFGFTRALFVLLGYLVINFVIGTLIEPRIVGKRVGLSTLVVFLSLIFWGSLFGLIGMVLCVPFTMALKYALETSDETRWLALLLESSDSSRKP